MEILKHRPAASTRVVTTAARAILLLLMLLLLGAWCPVAAAAMLALPNENIRRTGATNGDTPEQQIVLQTRIDLPRNVELDTILRCVDQLPAQGVDAYVTLDARLAWRPTEDLELALVGRNLIQSEHPEFIPTIIHTEPAAVQRSVYGNLTWRF